MSYQMLRLKNLLIENIDRAIIKDEFKKFLAFCKEELKLDKIPTIHWETTADVGGAHHSFGAFHNDDQSIHIVMSNRHPLDIMRTLAHELVHYKQWTEGRITPKSGMTGSSEENEAHAKAGVIMRNWGQKNPDMFKDKPIDKTKTLSGKTVLEDEPLKIKLRGFPKGPDEKGFDPASKVNAWIKKMYNSHHRNPLDPKQFVMTYGDGKELAMVELVPDINRLDTVDIQWFQAYPKRSGIGTQAMKDLQKYAAEAGITLVLRPWEKGQIPHSDLVNFYQKTGFQKLKGTTNTMIWYPPKKVTESDAPIGVDQEAGIGVDGKNYKFKVKDLIAKAKDYPVKNVNPELFKEQLKGIDEPEDSKKLRTDKADLQYPIIVVRYSGGLYIADGTHRVRKALAQGVKTIPAHIIPIADMKEFISEEKSDNTFYHVTLTRNIPNILKNGLVPTIGSLSTLAGEADPAIYMFDSLEAVEDAMMNWLGEYLPDEPVALIKIDLPSDMKARKMENDFGYEFIVRKVIPAEHLTVLTKDLDNDFKVLGDGEHLDEGKLLDKPTPTVAALAKKYKTTVQAVMTELRKGIAVEMEHTSKKAVAREIALDHLSERLDYYKELAKIDETLKKVKGRWALVSKSNPKKVLQYYKGSGHPSKEWVSKVERRVHSFSETAQLNEIANEPYPYKFIGYPFIHNTSAIFTTDAGQIYKVIIKQSDELDDAEIEFFADRENGSKLTNTGDAFRVFATVREILTKYLNSNKSIRTFYFGANYDEPSRVNLYDKIAKQISKYMPNFRQVKNDKENNKDIYHSKLYRFEKVLDPDTRKTRRVHSFSETVQLNELANEPYPYTLTERDPRYTDPDFGNQLAKGYFKTKDGLKYVVMITPAYDENGEEVDDKVSVEFSYSYFDVIPRHTQKITGTGDAFRIFGTVGKIVNQFLQNNPEIISFEYGAGKNEPSRIKFYGTMARVLSKYIPNFKLVNTEEGGSFIYYHFNKTKN